MTDEEYRREYEKAVAREQAESDAEALVERLTHFVNGMNRPHQDAFVEVLGHEHPTLIGQVAKVVGLAVLARGGSTRYCGLDNSHSGPAIIHPAHDGRLECNTVIGAVLMSRQSLI